MVSSPLLFLPTKLQSRFPGKEDDLSSHFQQYTDSQLEPSVFVLIAPSSCLNILYLYTILHLFCKSWYFSSCISKMQLLFIYNWVISEQARACDAPCLQTASTETVPAWESFGSNLLCDTQPWRGGAIRVCLLWLTPEALSACPWSECRMAGLLTQNPNLLWHHFSSGSDKKHPHTSCLINRL